MSKGNYNQPQAVAQVSQDNQKATPLGFDSDFDNQHMNSQQTNFQGLGAKRTLGLHVFP